MIMPAGMTILAQAAGPARIGRVMSVVGVPMLLGPILGPVLGGWLVDDVSWRWIFYVNVPIGAIAIALAWRILPADKPQQDQRLDALGLALLSPGLALFVFGLAETSGPDGFAEPQAFLPIAAGALLIAAFARHALRTSDPLIDLRLFRRRGPGFAAITMTLFATAFFGAMFLLPLYYQVARGQDALDAALLLIPQGIGAAIMMPIAGRIVDRVGARPIVLPGLVLMAAGLAVFTQVGADTDFWELRAASFVMGLGMGATMMPTMSAAYVSLTHGEIPRATTAMNILQRVGGAIGTALLSVVLANQLTDRLPAADGGGNALGAAQNAPAAARAQIAPLVSEAFAHTFTWALLLLVLAAIPAWFLPRGKPPAPVPPGSSGEPDETPVPTAV
jgi:EmrB/QacA subfamily drug resistance transporter